MDRSHVQISCVCKVTKKTESFDGFAARIDNSPADIKRADEAALADATRKARDAGWQGDGLDYAPGVKMPAPQPGKTYVNTLGIGQSYSYKGAPLTIMQVGNGNPAGLTTDGGTVLPVGTVYSDSGIRMQVTGPELAIAVP